MLEWRLDAFQRWLTMDEPTWAMVHYPTIDYQDASYYAAPKKKPKYKSLDEVDPEILETYKKLGIPLQEAEVLLGVEGAPRMAVDAVFDSVRVVTTFKDGAGEGRRHLLLDQRSGARTSRAGAQISRHRRADDATISSRR